MANKRQAITPNSNIFQDSPLQTATVASWAGAITAAESEASLRDAIKATLANDLVNSQESPTRSVSVTTVCVSEAERTRRWMAWSSVMTSLSAACVLPADLGVRVESYIDPSDEPVLILGQSMIKSEDEALGILANITIGDALTLMKSLGPNAGETVLLRFLLAAGSTTYLDSAVRGGGKCWPLRQMGLHLTPAGLKFYCMAKQIPLILE